jgi:hypothetical protein
LGEEFSGKRNLPPAKVVAIVLGVLVVGLVVGAIAFRAKSPATGSIDNIEAVEVPDQNMVMVAVNISLENASKDDFKIHTISAEVEAADGPHQDNAAAPMDFARYLEALPALKAHSLEPLSLETLAPGRKRSGSIVVTFPGSADAFAKRKSFKVTIWAFREVAPLVLIGK